LKRKLAQKQRGVPALGKTGEKKAKEWLEDRGFIIEEWFPHAHAGYYDIKARKGQERWIIEVKTGSNPSLNITNFLKMINEKGFNRIGLAIVSKHYVYLLEVRKTRIVALKAWKTRKK
jgi:Holliday junction resolvase-like predicted endonuclease